MAFAGMWGNKKHMKWKHEQGRDNGPPEKRRLYTDTPLCPLFVQEMGHAKKKSSFGSHLVADSSSHGLQGPELQRGTLIKLGMWNDTTQATFDTLFHHSFQVGEPTTFL